MSKINTFHILENDYNNLSIKSDDTLYYISDNDTKFDTKISADINYDYEKIFNEMAKRFNKVPTLEHKCNNCGATLDINADKHIFICKYCNSVYAIGTTNINDRG